MWTKEKADVQTEKADVPTKEEKEGLWCSLKAERKKI